MKWTTWTRSVVVTTTLGASLAMLPAVAPSTGAPQAEAGVPIYKIGWSDFGSHHLVDPDGSNNVQIGPASGGDFDWTPDGLKLVYLNNGIRVRNQNGADFPVGVSGLGPELSPDGTKIAYYEKGATPEQDVVKVVDLDGNELADLGSGSDPTWSPDGTKIAFSKRTTVTGIDCVGDTRNPPQSESRGMDGIAVAPATGGASSWLVNPADEIATDTYWLGASDPDWSPDGTTIVFFGSKETYEWNPNSGNFGDCGTPFAGDDREILTVSSGGGEPTNLTTSEVYDPPGGDPRLEPEDLNPSYSPDGSQIAFASDRKTWADGGVHSLWVMDANGANPQQVLVTNRVDETDWTTALPEGVQVTIEAPDDIAEEDGQKPGTFVIERTGATDGELEVDIKVAASSTATEGDDYNPLPDTVTIPEDTTLVNLVVFPEDDDIEEDDETITVEIEDAGGGYLVGEPSSATMTIIDDDGPPFPDVPPWVAEAVEWIAEQGYVDGYADGTFGPNRDITRAQVTRILYRIAGSPPVTDGSFDHGLSDVPLWVDDAVRWITHDPDGDGPAVPLATGYPNGTYRPNLPITRAQVTRMLFRMADSPPGSPAHVFSDVPPWVAPAVSWITDPAQDPPYASGYDNGTYRPNLNITRAQVTRMLYRIHG